MRASKYDPLKRFLMARKDSRIPMTFAEIERILGRPLPASARTHRAWWSNNPTNNVMTYAWLAAGYRTAQVDLAGERLVFVRAVENAAKPDKKEPYSNSVAASKALLSSSKRPLYGFMRGSLRIREGVDVTAPAAPEWGDRAEAEALRPLASTLEKEREDC